MIDTNVETKKKKKKRAGIEMMGKRMSDNTGFEMKPLSRLARYNQSSRFEKDGISQCQGWMT